MGLLDWLFGGRRKDDDRDSAQASPASTAARPAIPPSPKLPVQRVPFITWREGSYPMEVVGESQFQDALERICGPHTREGYRVEVNATLIREPHNPHDRNAVGVEVYGEKVGYLSRDDAERVGGQMDEEGLGQVRCGGLVKGGWRTNQYDEGSFGVWLAIPRRGWIDMGTGKQAPVVARRAPTPINRPKPAKEGPLVGQWVVLWGMSDTGPEAVELANLGAKIMAGVGVSTTMLIHSEDILTTGALRSATYEKAQERIATGSKIEIISLRKLRERLGLDTGDAS